MWKRKLADGKISKEDYDVFADSHYCAQNTHRSSPAMEAEAAQNLWMRSEEKLQLRYTTYIGDGDFKGYIAAREAKL